MKADTIKQEKLVTVTNLKCKECGAKYPKVAQHVCELCFGPLEVVYDYDLIKTVLSRDAIQKRAQNMWRYRELLPVDGLETVGLQVGFTPLWSAKRLAKVLGVREVYIKNDAVNFPTLSFKDRVVAVALSKAKELGFTVVACASTGNLANSVAANAASAGLDSYVFIPANLEQGKIIGSLVYNTHLVGIQGHYDEVNRLCSEIADKYGWAFVNINIRPYYGEGSKSMGFEIVEQLGWRTPQHIVVPMAGGSLITKIRKAFHEMKILGLIENDDCKIHGAQAEGCGPIVTAVKNGWDIFKPVEKPDTIAKSLAIGNPADGYYAIQTMKHSGGDADHASDSEIVDGIRLLAETEGVFAETAGGVTIATCRRLIKRGIIGKNDEVVLCITGNGLKTMECLESILTIKNVIQANLKEFDQLYQKSVMK